MTEAPATTEFIENRLAWRSAYLIQWLQEMNCSIKDVELVEVVSWVGPQMVAEYSVRLKPRGETK